MGLTSKIFFKIYDYYNRLLYFLISSYTKIFKSIPNVYSIDKSIEKILSDKCSVSRFGDGEIRLISKQSIEFQDSLTELVERLSYILNSESKNHMVCIPDIFLSLKPYKKSIRWFWRKHLNKFMFTWLNFTRSKKYFGNAFITRPYISYTNYNQSQIWFNMIKQIWEQRDIVIIEGNESRLGIGNDLFNNCNSIKRILCPSTNAYYYYKEILEEAKLINKSKLILIALGPTATVLAYDLHNFGYQALDIGHIDIEYEWFLMKAKGKVNIPNKHTNEAIGTFHVEDVSDKNYLFSILCRIPK